LNAHSQLSKTELDESLGDIHGLIVGMYSERQARCPHIYILTRTTDREIEIVQQLADDLLKNNKLLLDISAACSDLDW
jgi:hypothetical protein